MAFLEKLTLLVEVVSGNSKSVLSQLTTNFKNADGAAAKLKVSAKGVGDFLKQYSAQGALLAGTAVAAFAVKSVKSFEDVTLAVGKFRDATGTTSEEASRFVEVADQLGIGADTMQLAIGKLNRTAADTPEAFDEIGAAIAKNEDGTTNVTETFYNTIDALNGIPDATKRASAAQQIFGRGWQKVTELVGEGADEVRAKLEAVEGTKVFNDDQIDQGRALRDTLDDLQDTLEDVSLTVGQALVPALQDLGDTVNAIKGPIAGVKSAFDTVTGAPVIKQIYENLAPWEQLGTRIGQVGGALGKVQGLLGKNIESRTFDPTELNAYRDNLAKVQQILEAGFENTSIAEVAEATERAASAHEGFQRAVAHGEAEKESAEAADAAAIAHEGLQQAYLDSAAAADKARQAAHDLRVENLAAAGGVFDLESNQLALADAMVDITDRQKDAADAVDEFGAHSDEARAATNDLRQAQISAATQALATATAFADQSGAAEGSRKHTNLMRDALTMLAAENPGIRGEIQQMIDKLNKIPPKKHTEVGLDGKDTAVADADDVGKHIKDIPDREPKVTLNTADVYSSADAVERRLNDIPNEDVQIVVETIYRNVVENVPAAIGVLGPGTEHAMMSGSGGGGGGGPLSVPGRARRMFRSAAGMAVEADELRKQAAATRELAKATEDADEKERLFAEASNKVDRANDLMAKSTDTARAAVELQSVALRNNATALHNNAEAQREHAAALTERSASIGEAVDAELALHQAQRAAVDAGRAVREADATSAVGSRARAEAYDGAREAALNLANAEVELERQQAEAHGRQFTDLDATRVLRESLARQARTGNAAVAVELRDLIKDLNFPGQIRLEKAAAKQERVADHEDKVANKWDRVADKLLNGNIGRPIQLVVNGPGLSTPEAVIKAIRQYEQRNGARWRGG